MAQLQDRFGVSERRASKIISISRSSLTYVPKARDCSAIRMCNDRNRPVVTTCCG